MVGVMVCDPSFEMRPVFAGLTAKGKSLASGIA